MFKRSLASVAAVAIASGAVVAPANAMTAKFNKDDMSCIVYLTPEEVKSSGLHASPKFEKGEAATNKANSIEPRLLNLRTQIKKDKEALTKPGLEDELKNDLMRNLEKNKKELTVYENFRDALDACIEGKDYDSDKSGGAQNPEEPKKPEGPKKPERPNNPGATPAPPSNDGAGIGVIFAGAIAAILGILAAALPIIKPMLPPQLRALLP
nr:hypothetical protein FRC0137_02162 [Corynebacterium diphtheriae]CAB0873252.1 hypothetical protein FRC0375_02156 [Corynebacterium diphtheriae]